MQQHHSMKLRGEKKVHNSEGPFPCILRIAAVREAGGGATDESQRPSFPFSPFPLPLSLFRGGGGTCIVKRHQKTAKKKRKRNGGGGRGKRRRINCTGGIFWPAASAYLASTSRPSMPTPPPHRDGAKRQWVRGGGGGGGGGGEEGPTSQLGGKSGSCVEISIAIAGFSIHRRPTRLRFFLFRFFFLFCPSLPPT